MFKKIKGRRIFVSLTQILILVNRRNNWISYNVTTKDCIKKNKKKTDKFVEPIKRGFHIKMAFKGPD